MHSGRALNTVTSLVPRVYIQIFTASVGMGMLVPTLPLFVADLVRDPRSSEVNITLVGLAVGMAALGTLLWTLPSGLLLNRISEWIGQIAGLVVMATAVMVLALSPPYSVLIVQMKPGDDAQDSLAAEIHDRLESEGVDVLLDDRKKVSPGAKFKDADLVGIPLRIVVGRDAADRNVEWNERAGADKEVIAADDAIDRVLAAVRGVEPATAGA